ncbi:MAG: hypothetical protein ABIN25_06080 [Ginsengibacter sp.]
MIPPQRKIYLDKDEGRKKHLPGDLTLPAILLCDSLHTKMLVNASGISDVHTLTNLISLLQHKLSAEESQDD